MKSILVTGGAGYIGSHTVRQLSESPLHSQNNIIVLDTLETGFRESIPKNITFIQGNVGDQELVHSILEKHNVNSIIHFAASLVVPESVANPSKYYRNNSFNTLNLLECAVKQNVKHFIFSSTASVYGNSDQATIGESTPAQPINPSGFSKMISEQFIKDISKISALQYVILRYFNVAGAASDLSNGQKSKNASHLIKIACEVICKKRESMTIFGTDYPTKDGTGTRDYIHVEDLADLHVLALSYLDQGGLSGTFNCGYGHGFTVREVIHTLEKVSQTKILAHDGARRAGDPAVVISDVQKIKHAFHWKPRHDNIDEICKSALLWEQHSLTS